MKNYRSVKQFSRVHASIVLGLVRHRSFVDQLGSSREELPVSEAISRVHTSIVLGLRHMSLVGRVVRTNAFEVM